MSDLTPPTAGQTYAFLNFVSIEKYLLDDIQHSETAAGSSIKSTTTKIGFAISLHSDNRLFNLSS